MRIYQNLSQTVHIRETSYLICSHMYTALPSTNNFLGSRTTNMTLQLYTDNTYRTCSGKSMNCTLELYYELNCTMKCTKTMNWWFTVHDMSTRGSWWFTVHDVSTRGSWWFTVHDMSTRGSWLFTEHDVWTRGSWWFSAWAHVDTW